MSNELLPSRIGGNYYVVYLAASCPSVVTFKFNLDILYAIAHDSANVETFKLIVPLNCYQCLNPEILVDLSII